jgi:hypothetical protein
MSDTYVAGGPGWETQSAGTHRIFLDWRALTYASMSQKIGIDYAHAL